MTECWLEYIAPYGEKPAYAEIPHASRSPGYDALARSVYGDLTSPQRFIGAGNNVKALQGLALTISIGSKAVRMPALHQDPVGVLDLVKPGVWGESQGSITCLQRFCTHRAILAHRLQLHGQAHARLSTYYGDFHCVAHSALVQRIE